MRNEKLRQEKIARNKKRRILRKKSRDIETLEQRKMRIKSFSIAGSIHGARKIRKSAKEKMRDFISKRIKFKFTDLFS